MGMKVETGAGYAAWMNGLNKRNHAVVDRCYGKVMKENPGTQGANLPNLMTDKLPALERVTTSQSVAAHINAMHGARKEFMVAQCDKKIRRVLRHKVRAVERSYKAGEEVYYKGDSDRGVWRGPATVIGTRGTVAFLVHQGELGRVAACRLVHTGEPEDQMNGVNSNHPEQSET